MATSFLLKPIIKLNSLTNQYPLINQVSPIIPFLPRSQDFSRLITNPKLTVKCSVATSKNLSTPVLKTAKNEITKNPFEIFVANAILKPLQETTVVVVLFVVLTFLCTAGSAFAAGGGRMGGRSFSSSSSSSRGSSSRGSSSSGGSSYKSSSSGGSSYKSSPPSGGSSYEGFSSSSGSSSGGYSSSSTFKSSPSSSSSTIYTSSSDDGEKTTLVESVSVDGKQAIKITQQNKGAYWSRTNIVAATMSVMFITGVAIAYCGSGNPSPVVQKSVLKLQVGVLGSAKSLQRELNRIAENADTSNKVGLTYILKETTRALLQHPDYWISGYSSVDVKRNMEDVETLFNSISIEERGKLDEETLVNVDNIKKQSTSSKDSTGVNNEYIVITILVAAEEVLKLPTIRCSESLKEALTMLGSITTNKTLAVEVLWTPQDENEILTEQEVLKDYPLLRPLN